MQKAPLSPRYPRTEKVRRDFLFVGLRVEPAVRDALIRRAHQSERTLGQTARLLILAGLKATATEADADPTTRPDA